MNPKLERAITQKLLGLADDELILAHRNSEWSGHGPILEEDIAFSNIALDEMGHAATWYGLYEDLIGTEPDQLAFFRNAEAFRSVQMVELPRGDWGFSMMRQFLFDVYEMVQLGHLVDSSYTPLAEAAAKIRPEEMYHLRHTRNWIKRLGLGTAESRQRLQAALADLWPYAHQLFVPLPEEALLVAEKVVVETAVLWQQWLDVVRPFLSECGLTIPSNDTPPVTKRSQHTEYLTNLLDEMQAVARLDPQAQW